MKTFLKSTLLASALVTTMFVNSSIYAERSKRVYEVTCTFDDGSGYYSVLVGSFDAMVEVIYDCVTSQDGTPTVSGFSAAE